MKFCYLFLVLAVAAANAEVFDINKWVDIGLAKVNQYLRAYRYTSVHLPDGSYGPHITYSGSDILGIDSLKRTANCTLEVDGENATLDYHYGFGFFQQSFKYLNISGEDMSASYRIRDNSARLHYTAENFKHPSRCHITVHDVTYERMAGVEFSSSRPEYDAIALDPYFKEVIVPFLNSKLDKAAIQEALQRFACNPHYEDLSEHMPFIHQTILTQLGAVSH